MSPRTVQVGGACRRSSAALLFSLTAIALSACAAGVTAGPGCLPDGPSVPLPAEIGESSGVAWSVRHPGVIWTINDGRDQNIYAVDSTGALLARISMDLPEVWDVEDLAIGPCGDESCLFVADIGDNYRFRDTLSIYRVREPDLDATTAEVDVFHMRLPDAPTDIETLLLGANGQVWLLSKGNREAVSLFKYPGALRSDTIMPLVEVHRVESSGRSLQKQITGASSIPGTDAFVIRTYEGLAVYRIVDDMLQMLEGTELRLGVLREPQGEAVAVRGDGRVVLTSEAGPLGTLGGMNFLVCTAMGN